MTFAISMGVRRGNRELLDQINESLSREQSKIDAILEAYHVPLENTAAGSRAASAAP
jgi:hypothetical protein